MIIYKNLENEEFNRFKEKDFKFFVLFGIRVKELVTLKRELDKIMNDYYIWCPCKEVKKDKRWYRTYDKIELFPYTPSYIFLLLPQYFSEIGKVIEEQRQWWKLLKSGCDYQEDFEKIKDKELKNIRVHAVPYNQIETMIEGIRDYEKESNQEFQVGSTVKIKNGPLFNIEGRILSVLENGKINIEASLFRRQINICLDKEEVEVIEKPWDVVMEYGKEWKDKNIKGNNFKGGTVEKDI